MIRKATLGDGEALWRLLCILEGRELDRAALLRILEGQLADSRRVLLVWEQDEDGGGLADPRPRAFLNMKIEPQLHHAGRVAEIQELVVDPALRGRGVGHRLFTVALDAARDARCVRLELATNRGRLGAHRFYERERMAQTHFGYTLDL